MYRTMNGVITKLYDTTKGGIREMLRGEKLPFDIDRYTALWWTEHIQLKLDTNIGLTEGI